MAQGIVSRTGSESAHTPVLLEEVLSALSPRPGGRYLDGTLGLGGHSAGIIERAGRAALVGLDRDSTAIELAKKRLEQHQSTSELHFFHLCFDLFAQALDELKWEHVDGALIDIGVSSMQIDDNERGFSFISDGPLDMRMDQGYGESARTLVNRARQDELKKIISVYGEDPQAGRIARAIVTARNLKPVETTRELSAIVESAYPASWRRKARNHPATRTFQALRMVINDELGQLERFLSSILDRMAPGGRVAVITFHSLEDRLVKHTMRAWARGCICPAHIPLCQCGNKPRARVLTAKPIRPHPKEYSVNPRASSAKLRVAEKLDTP
jgi:16S rRNA (cytosine1402-N4)-methyltransferase